jgi:hypothetical protein
MTAVVYNDAQFEQVRHHLHVKPLPYIFLRCREWLKYGKALNLGRWFCSPVCKSTTFTGIPTWHSSLGLLVQPA